MSNIHLVIPDSHAKPGVSNERYRWLGKLIMDVRPSVIINLGDMADMYSLNAYDRGTAQFQGARYRDDIDAVKEALHELYAPMKAFNKRMARNKKRGYKPRQIMCLGNHEHRINKAINSDETLIGLMSTQDLGYEEYYEVYKYLDIVPVDGIAYTHCMQHKNSAQMIGGAHQANSLLMKKHCSVTVGHSHLLDYKTDTTGLGTRIHGLVAGCYFEHHEGYANQSNENWWRGVVIKHNVNNGDYEPEFITIDRIRQEYGE